jgi:hypothetical protein
VEKLGIDVPVIDWAEEDGVDQEVMRERLYKAADEHMAAKAAQVRPRDHAQRSKSRCCCRPSTANGASTC